MVQKLSIDGPKRKIAANLAELPQLLGIVKVVSEVQAEGATKEAEEA